MACDREQRKTTKQEGETKALRHEQYSVLKQHFSTRRRAAASREAQVLRFERLLEDGLCTN
jgi:hypothetical protein